MSSTLTTPNTIEVSTADNPFPLECDATGLLAVSETVTGITTTLTDLATGLPVILTAPPTFTTTSATQPIIGSSLTAGQRLRLVWIFHLSTGIVLGVATFLKVDF
jgi:hypothetical protein